MKTRMIPLGVAASALAAAALLNGCGSGSSAPTAVNTLPNNITHLSVTTYSATAPGAGTTAATQDLLTGGLGKSGLAAAAAPAYANPLAPTALELRRNALYSNYRGLVDFTAAGGFGTLYGPNVDVNGNVTTSEGLIPGREYLAVLDDATGRKRVTVVVQIPDSFNASAPCLVLGPSSGSRGVYGAIATAGEWGLKHGCAVALTDAGKGIGLYDMMDDSVNKIDGTRASRADAGSLAHFAANITDAARTAYNALFPNRLALKQAQSQLNPEKDWGTDTLAAAAYAIYALNDRYGVPGYVPFTPANVLTIAGSASNGGAAVLHAAEQDTAGYIKGVVAGEPVTQLATTTGFGVQLGGVPVGGYGKGLADFTTYGNIYQPCAALAPAAALTEVSIFNYIGLTGMTARATARCDGLAAKGLVSGADTAARATDALNKLRAYGWTADNDQMHNAHYALGNGPILSAMYPMAYGRLSALDNVCNTSFAQTDAVTGAVVAVTAATKAASFALANGTANGTPANVVYNDSVGGAKGWQFAVSPSTGVADLGLDNALCQRALVTGVDAVTGAALTAASYPTAAQSTAVRAGIAEVQISGNLRGKPTIVLAGRSDALVPVNNNARAYVALNKVAEAAGKLSYIEVTNAQHFDTFLPFSGFDTRYVPLHVYFNRAMDAVYANLRSGTALPPSQVVRTTARGGTPGAAPAITAANVPAIAASPATANQIVFSGTSLNVPN